MVIRGRYKRSVGRKGCRLIVSITALEQTRIRWYPETKEDRSLVLLEMEEILSTSQFTSSKRYPAFLRYVVDQALSGHSEDIKERSGSGWRGSTMRIFTGTRSTLSCRRDRMFLSFIATRLRQ